MSVPTPIAVPVACACAACVTLLATAVQAWLLHYNAEMRMVFHVQKTEHHDIILYTELNNHHQRLRLSESQTV